LRQSILTGRAEVNAGIDAGIGVLSRGLREAGERTCDARKRRSARRGEADRVRAEESRERFGRTLRLNEALRLIGLAVGGEAGSRLAIALGMNVTTNGCDKRKGRRSYPNFAQIRVLFLGS
jgi:hypothetical protein